MSTFTVNPHPENNCLKELALPLDAINKAAARETSIRQAPEAKRVPREMQAFLKWFNAPPAIDPVMAAGLAHLWFVTIHPFEDGNGRIARAIADMTLARSENSTQRFYSMSAQIRLERKAYYDTLEQTQKGGLDITPWLEWFLAVLIAPLKVRNTSWPVSS